MKTRDLDVRGKLHEVLSREFLCDDDTVMVDELGLCQGEARVDVAIINGYIHGYEIKSDSDTLERLPRQIDVYNRVLDTVTIVVGKSHIKKVYSLVPEWWGITQAEKIGKDNIFFVNTRKPKRNPNIDPFSLVQLLWRDEALELLIILGLQKGYLSKSRREIWTKIANSVSLSDLQTYVRERLKSRCGWRAVEQQM